MIPDNDPVRLLNACVEGMDLSELYKTYTRVPKNLATPKQLFKIVVYAAMNGIYSSRKIEAACFHIPSSRTVLKRTHVRIHMAPAQERPHFL